MGRGLRNAFVAVLMLAAAGCTLDSFLVQQVVWGPKLVVPGTVAEVSSKLQDELSDAGIMLAIKRVDVDLRIAGVAPKTRTAFCLHLTEKKINGSVKTLLRMQWDRGGDEELWQRIQKIVTASPAKDSEKRQE